MQVMDLYFRFKGGRDYLHGTDMYQNIVGLIDRIKPGAFRGAFRMTIHDIVRRQCQLLYSDWAGGISKPKNSKVEFNFVSDTARIIGWLVETTDPVVERYQYNEELIIQRCAIKENSVTIENKTPYSAIEVLVAMNKHLHLSLFPEADGKWYFTRLDLERLLRPADAIRFRLKLVQNLQNRLTKSQILIDDQKIGDIYFSLVKQ